MDRKTLYEKLGAVWFQKVVFKAEDLKFKFIDRFCPNIGTWYNKRCDIKASKLISKTIDSERQKDIIFKYNYKKMAFNRELVEKKNRNYHMTLNNASSFYKHLEHNKKVHMNGIKFNIGVIISSLVMLPYISGALACVVGFVLAYNVFALGINFQCVNLQNYNMCRFNEKKEILEKIEQRKKESDAKNYALAGAAIYKKLESSVTLPKKEEIVKEMTSLEELQELRKLALEIKRQRSSNGSKDGVKQMIRK